MLIWATEKGDAGDKRDSGGKQRDGETERFEERFGGRSGKTSGGSKKTD